VDLVGLGYVQYGPVHTVYTYRYHMPHVVVLIFITKTRYTDVNTYKYRYRDTSRSIARVLLY